MVGAFVLGAVARGVGRHGDGQRAADLAALAGARTMHAAYERLFEPAFIGDVPNPRHLEKAVYLEMGREAAERTAQLNGAPDATVSFPDASSFAPVRIRAAVASRAEVGSGRGVDLRAAAEAELSPPGGGLTGLASGGGYNGPLAYRQGKPMRPDVAQAFDRMAAAAARAGVHLTINSGYRSDAEQAILFRRNPDPRWVAPPGQSLHRLGTELDLGSRAAYGWLATNAKRFGFAQRYSWEPWHYGYTRNAGSASVGFGGSGATGAARCRRSCPPGSRRRSPARRSAGACLPGCCRRSSTRSPTSTPSPARPRGRRASPSSCPARRAPTGCRTRSTPRRRSTPRPT